MKQNNAIKQVAKKKKPNILGRLLYNENSISSQESKVEICGKGWLPKRKQKKKKKNVGCILRTFVRETLNRLKI